MPHKGGPFLRLDETAMRGLAPHSAARAFPKNVVVVHEGDATDSLYVVLAGRV